MFNRVKRSIRADCSTLHVAVAIGPNSIITKLVHKRIRRRHAASIHHTNDFAVRCGDILHKSAVIPGATITRRDPNSTVIHRDNTATKMLAHLRRIRLHKNITNVCQNTIRAQSPACSSRHGPSRHRLRVCPKQHTISIKVGGGSDIKHPTLPVIRYRRVAFDRISHTTVSIDNPHPTGAFSDDKLTPGKGRNPPWALKPTGKCCDLYCRLSQTWRTRLVFKRWCKRCIGGALINFSKGQCWDNGKKGNKAHGGYPQLVVTTQLKAADIKAKSSSRIQAVNCPSGSIRNR